MRHQKSGVKLGRTSSHREAMFRNMVTSLLKHDRIKTTTPKAKELRRWADHVVTLAKRGDLHARRQVLAIVREQDVVHKLFDEAAERFGAQDGGYTRVIKAGYRQGDTAPMSIVEFVAAGEKTEKKKSKAPAKPAQASQPTAPPVTDESGPEPEDASSDEDIVATAGVSVAEDPVKASTAAGTDQDVTSEAAAEKEADEPSEDAAKDESATDSAAEESKTPEA